MERISHSPETQTEQVRALSPQEIMELKQEMTPPIVLETVNRLLAENLTTTGRAHIRQNDILEALVASGLDRREVFDKNWLDIESQYREAGWQVTYESPSYDENYDAYFEFSVPKPNTVGAAAVRNSVRRS